MYRTYYDSESAQKLAKLIDFENKSEKNYFDTHLGRFSYLVDLINSFKIESPLIDIGGTPLTKRIFSELTCVSEVELSPNVDLEIDNWYPLISKNDYDIAIMSEVIEHFNADPAHALWQINKSLKINGMLILTTVNISSQLSIYSQFLGESPYAMLNLHGKRGDRHQHEYSPIELQRLVAANGFKAYVKTINLYQGRAFKQEAQEFIENHSFNTDLHGDTIVIVAKKIIDLDEPYRIGPPYHHKISTNKPGDFSDIRNRIPTDWIFEEGGGHEM